MAPESTRFSQGAVTTEQCALWGKKGAGIRFSLALKSIDDNFWGSGSWLNFDTGSVGGCWLNKNLRTGMEGRWTDGPVVEGKQSGENWKRDFKKGGIAGKAA